MSDLLFSINVTLPIFLVMVIGWVLHQIGMLDEHFVTVANRFNFKVTLPFMLFRDIASVDIWEVFDLKFVLFCAIVSTICFWSIWGLTKVFLKDQSMRGAFVQASFRSSAAVMGLAFISNIYGSSAMGPLMIIGAVPLYNIYSVIILTFSAADRTSGKNAIKISLISILKNPILIGIFAGLPFALFRIQIPTIPMKTITLVAQTASPIALLVVGANFEGKKALAKMKPTCIATLLKLIIIPAIFIPVAVLIGFRNEALVAIAIMLGSPTTVTCYIMAKNLKNDEVLSSSIIVLATLLSSFSLTAIVFILRYNGLI